MNLSPINRHDGESYEESRPIAFNGVRKTRGKYSSRACVQCRKRKLKCSGKEPCHRCSKTHQPCLFSDNPAMIAEFLRRNNSRPVRGRAASPHAALGVTNSDPATIELAERMKKVESILDTLVRLLPHSDSRDSVEPQPPEENDGFQGETAFQAPVDAFNAKLASLRERLGYQASVSPPTHSSDSLHIGSHSTPANSSGTEPLTTVRLGSRELPFPAPAEYARYRDFFFDDINACHPCLNEADFNTRCRRFLTTGVADPPDTCVLALNYILFAYTDILTDTSPVQQRGKLPGWRWYHAADELMRKRKLSGRGDLALLQYLVYEALYLTYADKANAAYNVAGLACRLCFQFGLNQQRLWGTDCTPFSKHMRQRLFWTIYFLDRRISLSCGRPYAIRDSDIDVDLPAWIDDKALFPDQPLPEMNAENTYNVYLSYMVAFARFAGEIWDQVFSATSADNSDLGEKIAILDARIRYWLDTTMPSTPLISQQSNPTKSYLWQYAQVRTRMNHLRLLLRRRTMVSLTYGAADGLICGEMAMDIVRDINLYASEAKRPSSYRFHMAISLGGAIIILATLLCRDLTTIGLHDHRSEYTDSYHLGMTILRDLAAGLNAAERIVEDLKNITNVVDLVLQYPNPDALENQDFSNLVPANMDDLFPQNIMDPLDIDLPDHDFEYIYGTSVGAGLPIDSTDGLIQSSQNGVTAMWDSWDHYELLRTPGAHGAPWV